jgi:D-glycero-alpha-D-manno-heptose-7-phosphate kinase
MIIAKTPLRVSFFGGGSDLPAFTDREDGAALSVSIDKFVYVILHETTKNIRFLHEEIEQVYNIAQMRNKIVSNALTYHNIDKGLDIVSLSDVPSVGSGLGGSSAFTVGLCSALLKHRWPVAEYTNEQFAQEAVRIEIDYCHFPIGIQDQYATAVGGFNLWKFFSKSRRAEITKKFYKWPECQPLEERLLLVHSGLQRVGSAGSILQEQQSALQSDEAKFQIMQSIRDRTYQGAELLEKGLLDRFGALLHDNWIDKKTLSHSLSDKRFDELYDKALDMGALGGKLLGAGGGGFFLFYIPEYIDKIQFGQELTEEYPTAKVFPFKFHYTGTELTHV